MNKNLQLPSHSFCSHWHGKPYFSLDAWCKNTYGEKLYKTAIDLGPESVNFVTNCFPNIAYFRCLLLVFIVQNCVPNGWKNNAVS